MTQNGLRHQTIMNAISSINALERPGLAGLRRRLLEQARLLNPTPQPAPAPVPVPIPEPMILQSNSFQRNVQEREQQDESVPVRQRLLTLPPREIVNLLPQQAQTQYERLLEMRRRSARFGPADMLNWRLLSSSLDREIRLYNQQQAAAGNNRGGKSSKKRRRSRRNKGRRRSRSRSRRSRSRSRRSSNSRMRRSRIRRRRY